MRYKNADGREYVSSTITLPAHLHKAAKDRGWKFSHILQAAIEAKLDEEAVKGEKCQK